MSDSARSCRSDSTDVRKRFHHPALRRGLRNPLHPNTIQYCVWPTFTCDPPCSRARVGPGLGLLADGPGRKQVARRDPPPAFELQVREPGRDWDMNVVLSGVQFALALSAISLAALALLGLWVLWTIDRSSPGRPREPRPLCVRVGTSRGHTGRYCADPTTPPHLRDPPPSALPPAPRRSAGWGHVRPPPLLHPH